MRLIFCSPCPRSSCSTTESSSAISRYDSSLAVSLVYSSLLMLMTLLQFSGADEALLKENIAKLEEL